MLGFSALSEIALSEQSGSVQPQGIVSLPAIFGTVQAVGAHVAGSTAAASMLGASAVVGSGVTGWASAAAILGSGQVVGSVPMSAWAAAPTMLGAQRAIAYHDFTDAVGDSITTYVMDLDTPGGLVRGLMGNAPGSPAFLPPAKGARVATEPGVNHAAVSPVVTA